MNNQTGLYLKYAIGEIILVVIGILIALHLPAREASAKQAGINNWNESRNNYKAEMAILSALKSEVSDNQRILSREIRRHQDALRLIKELSDHISPEPKIISEERLDSLMYGLGWLPGYTPNDGVINSIIASGKLALISNNKLNSKIAAWNSLLEFYKTTFDWSEKDVFELVLPYIKDKYPFKRTLEFFNAPTGQKSKFKFSQKALLSDLAFESIVAERIIDASDVFQAAIKLYDIQEEILDLIETEIQND